MIFNHRSARLACAGLGLAAASLMAHAQQTAPADPAAPSAVPSDTSPGSSTSSSTGSSMWGTGENYSLLPFTQRGYVGLNLGRAQFDDNCAIGGYTCDNSNLSGYVYTGGLVNGWLGAELGYYNSGAADRAGGSTRVQGVNLSAVLRAPLGVFNLFAKGGAIYGQSRVSTGPLSNVVEGRRRGWGGSFGGGAGFDFTPNSGVVLEWSRYQIKFPGGTHRQDVDTTSLGYVYRF